MTAAERAGEAERPPRGREGGDGRGRAFDVEVRITPREGILDPEGETIARALGTLGFDSVERVRAGRLVHLRLRAPDAGAAESSVRRMCEELIANPVIEDYTIRVRSGSGEREAADPGAAGRRPEPAGAEGGA